MSTDRIPSVAVIPTRDRIDLLLPLLMSLLAQPELTEVIIYDNSDDGAVGRSVLSGGGLRVIPAAGWGIYQMWNDGWAYAQARYDIVNVAILNDDILIPPDFIGELSRWLRASDHWLVFPDIHASDGGPIPGSYSLTSSAGTYRDGGMPGWAFMLRGELLNDPLPPIDESFEWWCGDDDLVAQIARHGGTIARVQGLPVGHHGEGTASLHAWTHAAKVRDLERFDAKYRRSTA